MELKEIVQDVATLRGDWQQRNTKFKEWYDLLRLVDALKTEGMETVALNDPRTFFNMALFLLTAGDVQHRSPLRGDTPDELSRQAKIQRTCEFVWREIDALRQTGGGIPFISELGFYLLLLGWYSIAAVINQETKLITPVVWSPAEVFPRFEDGQMTACVHEYKISQMTAVRKAKTRDWNYAPRTTTGFVLIDDYFYRDENNILQNHVLIDSKDVTGVVSRDKDLLLLVGPVGGFPDRGSITTGTEWRGFLGQGILEANQTMTLAMNKWVSMIMQNLRDTVQSKWQEFSSSQKATPEELRRYGSVFHYAPGEGGLRPVETQPPPIESRALLMDLEKRIQKGGFSDAVYGMVEKGTAGYALSQLTSSSANQILNPYMKAKDFIIEQLDRFQLDGIKSGGKAFVIGGKMNEEITSNDIPEEVHLEVFSEIATPRDWMERATVANMMKENVDSETILSEVYKFTDTEAIKRRKNLDDFNQNPMTKELKLIASYHAYADILQNAGDMRQAELFRRAASAKEAMMGAPPPGAASPAQAGEAGEAGAPEEKVRVRPEVAPPESRGGFTPQELRGIVGKGKVKRV